MTNILLFLLTTAVYSTIWFVAQNTSQKSIKQHLKELAIVAFLCLPLDINGNVFTVLGSATSSKSVFSLFSVYQKAENNAFSLFGSLIQEAGHDATVGIGLTGYQKAGHDAVVEFGLAGYQKAGHDAVVVMGVSGFQESDRALSIFGLVGYQKAADVAGVMCCFAGRQYGNNSADIFLGLVVHQASQKKSETYLSMALYQKVKEQDRSFAIWSKLEAKEQKEK